MHYDEYPHLIGTIPVEAGSPGWTIAAQGNYVYVGDESLSVIDITNPRTPLVVNDLGISAYAVAVNGTTACVAGGDSLHILSIADPAQPLIVSSIGVPGAYLVGISGDYVFIVGGLGQFPLPITLSIVDISNPSSPSPISGLELEGPASRMSVNGPHVYISMHRYGAPSGPRGLLVVNATDPRGPVVEGFLQTSGDASAVATNGDFAYLGVDRGDDGRPPEVAIINVENPASPVILSSITVGAAPSHLCIADGFVYASNASTSAPEGLVVIDVRQSSLPEIAWNLPYHGPAVVDGHYAYCAGNGDFCVVDIGNSQQLPALSLLQLPAAHESNRLIVVGDLAYLGWTADHGGGGGLDVIDVATPYAPSLLSTTYVGDTFDLAVSGDVACLVGYPAGYDVCLLDTANPASPSILGGVSTPAHHATGVDVQGEHLFVADDTSGILVIDIVDPRNPRVVGRADTPGEARKVSVAGDLVVAADGPGGLQVIDIHDPTAPLIVGALAVGFAWNVEVKGATAYVVLDDSVVMVDLGDPSSPQVIAEIPLRLYRGESGSAGLGDGLAVANHTLYCSGQGIEVVETCSVNGPLLVGSSSSGGRSAVDVAESFVCGANGGRFWTLPRRCTPCDCTVLGTVRDIDTGAPVADASVEATAGAVLVSEATCGIDGEYCLELAPGTYDLSAFANGSIPLARQSIVVPPSGQVVEDFALTSDPCYQWISKSPMPTARSAAASAVVDGKIYVIGGLNASGDLAANEAYDVASDSWSIRAPMPTRRSGCAAAVIGGKIYVVGGSPVPQGSPRTEIYDLQLNTWSTADDMPHPGWGVAAEAVDGKLYVFGGYSDIEQGMAHVRILDAAAPPGSQWTLGTPMPEARSWMASAADAVGFFPSIDIMGGWDRLDQNELDSVVRYSVEDDTWGVVESRRLPFPIRNQGVAGGPTLEVIHQLGGARGESATLRYFRNVYRFQVEWRPRGSLPYNVGGHCVEYIDGFIFVLGGRQGPGQFLGSVIRTDCPTTEREVTLQVLAQVRQEHDNDPFIDPLPPLSGLIVSISGWWQTKVTDQLGKVTFRIPYSVNGDFNLALWNSRYTILVNTGSGGQTVLRSHPLGSGPSTSFTWSHGDCLEEGAALQAALFAGRFVDFVGGALQYPMDALNILIYDNDQWLQEHGGSSFNLMPRPHPSEVKFLRHRGEEADITYHELSHALVADVFDDELGIVNRRVIGTGGGTINEGAAMDEAIADYFAASLTDDPAIARCPLWQTWPYNWIYCIRPLRNIDSGRRYPDVYRYTDIYEGSLILSGALWDLREDVGMQLCDELVFNGLREMIDGMPADASYEFVDLLNAMLVVDGGLHRASIERAFATHNIPATEPYHLPEWVGDEAFTRVDAGEGVIELDWQRAQGNVVAYDVLMQSVVWEGIQVHGIGEFIPIGVGLTDTTFSYVDRLGGAEYLFTVAAVDGSGQRGPSALPVFVPALEPVGISGSEVHSGSGGEGRWLFCTPNPFNPETRLVFSTAMADLVRLDVYNSSGRVVRSFGERVLEAGVHSVRWDGKDQGGRMVGSGQYFVKLRGKGWSDSGKILVIR